jgi:hypothetical protein
MLIEKVNMTSFTHFNLTLEYKIKDEIIFKS